MTNFKVDDRVMAFDGVEWSKTGDSPEGNDKFYKPATVKFIRIDKMSGRWLADIIFDFEQKDKILSRGHFQDGLKLISIDYDKI